MYKKSLCTLLACTSLCAHQVKLENGDDLKVDSLSLRMQSYTLHSKTLGRLEINKDKLAAISTDGEVYVTVGQHQRLKARLEALEGKQLVITPTHSLLLNDLSELSYLDPYSFEENMQVQTKNKVGGNLSKKYGNAKDLQTKLQAATAISFLELGKLTHKIDIEANYAFQQDPHKSDEEGRSFEREGLLDFTVKKRYWQKAFAFLGQELSFNSSKGVRFSSLSKLGLSYPFIEELKTHVEGALGLSRRDTIFETSPDKGQFDFLATLEGFRSFSEVFTLKAQLSYLPNVQKFSDYHARGKVSFCFDLLKPYLVEWSAQLEYDSTPDSGKKKADSSTAISFLVEF